VKRFKVGLTPKQAAGMHKASHDESALLHALQLDGPSHPNIVQFVEFYADEEGHACMVMTLADGGSAKSRMEGVWGHAHNATSDGPLKLFTAMEVTVYASQLISAIDFTHSRNVVHRDIKPGNVVFSADDVPMLADFGSARIIEDLSATVGGSSIGGTRGFMAPECLVNEPASPASDMWSFGATLLCLLTGHELANKSAVSTQLSRAFNKRPGAAWTLDAHLSSELSAEQKAAWAGEDAKGLRRVIATCLQVDDAVRPTAAELNADPLFVEARALEARVKHRVQPWKLKVRTLEDKCADLESRLEEANESLKEIQKLRDELTELKTMYQSMKDANSTLEAERPMHDAERKAHAKTRAELDVAVAVLANTRSALDAEETAHAAERQAHAVTKSNLKDEIKAHAATNATSGSRVGAFNSLYPGVLSPCTICNSPRMLISDLTPVCTNSRCMNFCKR
jgi:serine/threonine protein kinase